MASRTLAASAFNSVVLTISVSTSPMTTRRRAWSPQHVFRQFRYVLADAAQAFHRLRAQPRGFPSFIIASGTVMFARLTTASVIFTL